MDLFLDLDTWIFLIILGAIVLIILRVANPLAMDDTDDKAGGRLSGMSLYTDYGTGCQYLGKSGVLIPRVDGKGNHVGCNEN